MSGARGRDGGRGGGRLRSGQRPVSELQRLSISEQLLAFQQSEDTGGRQIDFAWVNGSRARAQSESTTPAPRPPARSHAQPTVSFNVCVFSYPPRGAVGPVGQRSMPGTIVCLSEQPHHLRLKLRLLLLLSPPPLLHRRRRR